MADFNWQTGYHRYQRYFTDLSKFYQKKKIRTYTSIILSLVTVIFFLSFAIRPTLTTITQLVRETKDQKNVAIEMEKKINNLSEAQTNYLSIEKELPLVEQALPKKPEVALLTKEIEALAKQAGVGIASLRFGGIDLTTDNKQQEKQEIKISLNILGDYPNLKSFLGNLMSLRRIILIEAFSFQTGKGEGNVLSLNLTAKAWFLINP